MFLVESLTMTVCQSLEIFPLALRMRKVTFDHVGVDECLMHVRSLPTNTKSALPSTVWQTFAPLIWPATVSKPLYPHENMRIRLVMDTSDTFQLNSRVGYRDAHE